MNSSDGTQGAPSSDPRLVYVAPELIEYGDASKLTATMGSGSLDDGAGDTIYSS